MPDDDLVPVILNIRAFSKETGEEVAVETLHSLLEEVLHGNDWDTSPCAAMLLSGDTGESQVVLVARIEAGEEISPFRLLPGIVEQMLTTEYAEGLALRAVSLYSEAWLYEFHDVDEAEIFATDESYAAAKETVDRVEAKTIATVDVVSGHQIHSMLMRGEMAYTREGPLQEGNAPEVLEYISQQYRPQ